MVLLPGCTCCGDKCKPCPYCTSEKCFKVTFSGFSQLPDTFSDCSDCRHLDNTTIVVRTHQAPNPAVTLTVTDSSGTGATFSNTLTTNADNSLSVSSASVTAGGSDYLSPVLVATPTQSIEGALFLYDTAIVCKQPTATFTLNPSPPTFPLSVVAPHGSGASITGGSSWQLVSSNPQGNIYELTTPGPATGGSGYQIGDTATLVNAERQQTAATVTINDVERLTPTVGGVLNSSTGSGFFQGILGSLSVSQIQDSNGKTAFTVSGTPSVPSWARGNGYKSTDTVTFNYGGAVTVQRSPVLRPTIAGYKTTINWVVEDGGKFRLDPFSLSAAGPNGTFSGGGSPNINVSPYASSSGGQVVYESFVEGGAQWSRIVSVSPSVVYTNSTTNYNTANYIAWTFGSGDVVSRMPSVKPSSVEVLDSDSGPVTGFTIEDGGEFFRRGHPTAMTVTSGGAYRSGGTITGITITDGGEIWPGAAIDSSPCGYSGGVCGGCPGEVSVSASYHPGARSTISGELVFGNDGHSLGLAGTLAVAATARSIDEQGNSLQCDSVSFPPERATGCYGNGTISVEPIDCDAQSVSPCPMPEQISLRVQWPAYTGWGGNSTDWLNCQIWPASDTDAYDETFILDRVTSFDFWGNGLKVYSPCSTIYGDNYSTGPQVHFHPLGNIVTATISPPDVPPSWYINPPERRTATAEVVGISGDHLTQITVTDGGEGYQYEIQQRVAPTVTLTADDSDGGSGASFTATLEQIGTGDAAVWGIKSVTVVNGGTGYPESGTVNVTTAEGQTTVEAAGLTFTSANGIITAVIKNAVQARRPPTVTVAGTSGSGAVLTPNVVGGVGTWQIDSVTVVSGGTGYVDREPAVFTLAEPEATVVCVPKGVVETVLEQPQITGVVWLTEGDPDFGVPPVTGTGAVFDVSSLVMETAYPEYEIYPCSEPRKRWGLSGGLGTDKSAIIVSGGSGYQVWNILRLSFAGPGVPPYPAEYDPDFPELYVSSVDENGAITGVALANPGRLARDTGVIDRVPTGQNGCPYLGVDFSNKWCPTGFFYIEDETVPVGKYFAVQPTGQMHTSVPTITIHAKIGTGAAATASVSNGAVSSISVTNGGSGYSPQRVVWVVDILCPFPSPNNGSTMYMQAGYSGADFADPFVDFFQSVPGFTITPQAREGLAANARACAGATPLADKISDNCPADLFGTYGLGVKTRRTWAASAPNGACGLDDPSGSTGYQTGGPTLPSGNLCLFWYSLYGTPLPKVWWLAGGSATIEAVDP